MKIIERYGVAVVILILLLSLLFNMYIIIEYFSKDWTSWTGFSDFSKSKFGSFYMCMHWIGGFIINILGSFQLLSKTGSIAENVKIRKLHKLSGKIYLFSVLLTCIGGFLFIFHIKTAGGIQMDTSFTIYGLLMLFCGIKTWINAGKNMALHFEWAIRLYSLGIGSMIYRILVIPVYLSKPNKFSTIQDYESWVSNYLITASWFFYFPNLLVAEIVIWYSRRKTTVVNSNPLNSECNVDYDSDEVVVNRVDSVDSGDERVESKV